MYRSLLCVRVSGEPRAGSRKSRNRVNAARRLFSRSPDPTTQFVGALSWLCDQAIGDNQEIFALALYPSTLDVLVDLVHSTHTAERLWDTVRDVSGTCTRYFEHRTGQHQENTHREVFTYALSSGVTKRRYPSEPISHPHVRLQNYEPSTEFCTRFFSSHSLGYDVPNCQPVTLARLLSRVGLYRVHATGDEKDQVLQQWRIEELVNILLDSPLLPEQYLVRLDAFFEKCDSLSHRPPTYNRLAACAVTALVIDILTTAKDDLDRPDALLSLMASSLRNSQEEFLAINRTRTSTDEAVAALIGVYRQALKEATAAGVVYPTPV